jgi:hypothetical protein
MKQRLTFRGQIVEHEQMVGSNARRRPSTILRCVFPALLLGMILLLPSPSWSHSRASTSSLYGTIKTVPNGIQLSLTNNGTDAFNGFLIQMVTSVQHRGAVMEGGTCSPGPAASNVQCAIAGAGFVPGATRIVTITTDGPYPPNGGAHLFTGPFGGPFSPAGNATGPEPATPCTCLSLGARIIPASIALTPGPAKADHGPSLALDFTVNWALRCSGGTGSGCKGTVKPTGHTYTVLGASNGQDTVIQCRASCTKTTGGGRRYRYATESDRVQLAKLGRISIVIRRTCQGKTLPPVSLWIAFDRAGRVSLKTSKLA